MKPEEFHQRLAQLYCQYNETIKPLIAEYEALKEEFPLPIFNEIRAFNDHIAQCYRDDSSDSRISDEIDRAERHILRIIFDCFKYLNVALYEKVEKFEKQTKYVELTRIDNGNFYISYSKLRKEATSAVREAKKLESIDRETSFKKFELAYQTYSELVELIENNTTKVFWAKAVSRVKRFGWLYAAIISAIISYLITAAINCTSLKDFFNSIF